MAIKVWSDNAAAALLDRRGRGSTLVYPPKTDPARAVSLTMPVRLSSWNTDFGLAPIFEMNLPEGALRERLRLAFAKATGSFDDLDILTIVGRSQIGRLRYTSEDAELTEEVPFQSVDEILARRRDSDLVPYLLERFATYSGVSGVQPKVLIRDRTPGGFDERLGIHGATHIVKFWETDHPELATNEHLCLLAAERCGLPVPRSRLAEDGKALVIDRFDRRVDGTYRGFEDMCVLNARKAADKYSGSYETSILKRFRDFASPESVVADSEQLFKLIALNCALRNGDAHLKNFGIIYDSIEGPVSLAPAYDIVTTTVYLPADVMALTLNGSTRWPSTEVLRQFGETRGIGSPARVRDLIEMVDNAVAETMPEAEALMRDRPEFYPIGERMLAEWKKGIARTAQ